MCLLEGLKVDWGPVYDQEIIAYMPMLIWENRKRKNLICAQQSHV